MTGARIEVARGYAAAHEEEFQPGAARPRRKNYRRVWKAAAGSLLRGGRSVASVRVLISGLHSDPDPSPGIGLARCVRAAFPDAQIIGIDYGPRSSGLHWPDFDEVRVQPPWPQIDLAVYASQIRRDLQASDCPTVWLSGLDVELAWLRGALPDEEGLLFPSSKALSHVRKPDIEGAVPLGMQLPPSLAASADDWELYRFARRAGWRVWVKGTFHDAVRVSGFAALRATLRDMTSIWGAEHVFVQREVEGDEESYAFAAWRGELLGAVRVEKRMVTPRGKTWAASVRPLSDEATTKVRLFVERTCWTGGGEVEFIHASDGSKFLIDLNPRFPAYIFGAALCGFNLPARLIAEATGLPYADPAAQSEQFVRVVVELPTRTSHHVPAIPKGAAMLAAGKHPSQQPKLRAKLTERGAQPLRGASRTPLPLPLGWSAAAAEALRTARTPARIRLGEVHESVVAEVTAATARFEEPFFTPALSVKTNPDPELGVIALRRGWWAEVISSAEAAWASRVGFARDSIVFNGPRSSTDDTSAAGIVFADSVDALATLRGRCNGAQLLGVRLRPPRVVSRFGIPLAEHAAVRDLVAELEQHSRWAVHFHVASDVVGPDAWWTLLMDVLQWARRIADLVGRPPAVLDVGGGWHSDDFNDLFLPRLDVLHEAVRAQLPSVTRVLLEPGKAVSERAGATVASILECRRAADGADVVIDASIADLPMALSQPHRILHLPKDGAPQWLGAGTDRVLGSICMESDVLSTRLGFKIAPRSGDRLLFFDAGAYDVSMAWPFAGGIVRD